MENKETGVTAKTKKYLESIAQSCLQRKLTIAVAESVTSGFVQLLLSNAENARCFFQGGLTAYNGAQKTKHLQIEPINAIACNCVSQDIAIEMAKNVRTLFCSDLGVAITGYATLVPREQITKLFAYVAITKKDKVVYKARITPSEKGIQGWDVQQDYSLQILQRLAAALKRWQNSG